MEVVYAELPPSGMLSQLSAPQPGRRASGSTCFSASKNKAGHAGVPMLGESEAHNQDQMVR
jgi:hypothetical protein